MYSYLISALLVSFSALFSGLTLGLMSLNVHDLQRKADLGDKKAKKILPLRKKGNLLLTTLLLGNVAVNATLSVFLSSLATGLIAGFVATALIFLLGEIIPQAVFSRHALSFGSKTAPIVKILVMLFWPVCAPIAWMLDKALGAELPSIYSREELMHVINQHEKSHESDLEKEEAAVIRGALTFSDKTVEDVMTPKIMVYSVDIDEELTPRFIKELSASGHSRFPVWSDSPDHIVGLLYLNKLVGKDLSGKTVEDFYTKRVKFVREEDLLGDVLDDFFKTRQQLFIVIDDFGGLEGLIALEDILEEIVGREIVDEFDRFADLRQVAKERAKKVLVH